ncbi:agmatinase [Ferrithrix thermotolerans DSM 19514]|uniref:Agmatinase n=1 Tax=Ferrithrix thermotolerans DSM 19514 TaxID=1121881 RepID=A0A1M4S7J5_9ACTN|nr:agmatinase [Ferrithrix thermotolerans]SHE28135.1 agmatinase [Ferrithrix thermotolerans DSM 19514]
MDKEPLGPPNSLVAPRFLTSSTFARLPSTDEVKDAQVIILGVPFDAGVSYRPGARFGPSAIRQGSKLLRPYNPALDTYPFKNVQVADDGDVAVNPFNIDEALGQIESRVSEHVRRGRRVLTLGGDHTIALPILRSMAAHYGSVALLHFDAHLDTWDTYFGAPYTHGTPFRRAFEENLLDSQRCFHLGTRGPLYDRSDLDDDESFGFRVIGVSEVEERGWRDCAMQLREELDDAPLYVSIDIDVLDPAFAPGTGTPEAGGLTSRELLHILRALQGANIVGADIVEVAPAYDHAEITSIAAAHLGYELVSIMSMLK